MQKTFYINTSFNIHNEYIEKIKLILKERGWIESSILPINFIYIQGLSFKTIFLDNVNNDVKNSDLINSIKGTTYDYLLDNHLFIQKYKNEFFIHPYQHIDINNIENIYKKYVIVPLFNINNKNWIEDPRNIVSSKAEIENHIKLNPDEKKWIIKDVLTEPCLKNGYRFTLNLMFLIKLNPFRVYLNKKKLYTLSKKLYDKDKMYADPYVRETSFYFTYDKDLSIKDNNIKEKDIFFFPDVMPDNWTKEETLQMDEMINNIVPRLFNADSKLELEPDANAKNGFTIFNATIDIYKGLPPIVHGLFLDWYPCFQTYIIPALISILIDNKDHPDLEKVNLNNKELKIPILSNYKFERQFSYGRTISKSPKSEKTFYIKTNYANFNKEITNILIKKGYKKSKDFPVNFIFINEEFTYYKNIFNTNNSNWISLLYGDSKAETTNKYLINSKYKDSNFINDKKTKTKSNSFTIIILVRVMNKKTEIYITNNKNKNVNDIISEIFAGQIDFFPSWNAENGFELFEAEFLESNKNLYFNSIRSKIDLSKYLELIPDIISLTIENTEPKYFIKIDNNVRIKKIINPKTFLIYSVYDKDQEFIKSMKSFLIKKGWKESNKLPVDFMFLNFSYKIEPPLLDTHKSKLVNLIKGSSFNNILNNELFITKFEDEYFIYPHKIINFNTKNQMDIDKEYILYPIFEKHVINKYSKKIVSSKKQIEKEIKLHPEYKKWMIQDILTEPVLKNGYIFHLNFIFLIKLNPFEIYMLKNKTYTKAKNLYDRNEYKINPDVYETKIETNESYPSHMPDGWSREETNYIDTMIENIISIIFRDKINIKPDNNSTNGYFIFNGCIRLFERLPPILYYVTNLFPTNTHVNIIPGLISILIDNSEHKDFKKVNINKSIKTITVATNNKTNSYDRFYSFEKLT